MYNRIKDLRFDRNITQAELGKAVNVSRITIETIENNKSNPNILLAFRIAKYFNLPIDQVFLMGESR